MYLVSKVCNTIKEFKYRFENNQIVEYDIVHPSYILKVQEDAFNFCTVPFTLDFNTFYECAISESNKLMGNINLDHEEERNDLIFISCVPWVSFTHILHPVSISPTDSIPRVAQDHHALMDGLHIGIFYQKLEDEIQKFINNEGVVYES